MTFVPSEQQANFFEFIENGRGSCVLEAVAGAGKTTTLIEGLKLMQGNIVFCAFNKKIVEEIAARAPASNRLKISTMHSLGLGAWRYARPGVRVDEKKTLKIMDEMQIEEDVATTVGQLVGFGQQVLRPDWEQIIDHFGIDCLGEENRVIDLAKAVYNTSLDACGTVISFNEMILAPIHFGAKMFRNDFTIIDEAQDMNETRRALALAMTKPNGRVIAVGDRAQAIYGFTGADHNSLDLIAEATNATRLPLTVTYRCPKAVVAVARGYVNHIEAHESAPEGAVLVGQFTDAQPGDAVLCRLNKPLISAAYALIKAGKGCRVEGREIGNGLLKLVRRWKGNNLTALCDKLEGYRESETTKLLAKGKAAQAEALNDKIDCLLTIAGRVQKVGTVQALEAEIDGMFGDNVKGNLIVLSSIHKAKGREWSRVFWMQTEQPKWARQVWEIQQENSLSYVAATRAKDTLVICPQPPKD